MPRMKFWMRPGAASIFVGAKTQNLIRLGRGIPKTDFLAGFRGIWGNSRRIFKILTTVCPWARRGQFFCLQLSLLKKLGKRFFQNFAKFQSGFKPLSSVRKMPGQSFWVRPEAALPFVVKATLAKKWFGLAIPKTDLGSSFWRIEGVLGYFFEFSKSFSELAGRGLSNWFRSRLSRIFGKWFFKNEPNFGGDLREIGPYDFSLAVFEDARKGWEGGAVVKLAIIFSGRYFLPFR